MTKLAYKDLAFLENQIARQNKILRLTRILYQTCSDIEEQEALAEIYRCAKDTKHEYIEKMKQLQGKE